MIALRLISWLFDGALITWAASVLLAGMMALSIEHGPRGTAAIRFSRNPPGWNAVVRSFGGPGVNLDGMREICHRGFSDPTIVKVCWMPPYRDWRIFDLDHDGDVDLFDIALMFRIAAPVREFPRDGLKTTYHTEELRGDG